jgi:feruloyl esterase
MLSAAECDRKGGRFVNVPTISSRAIAASLVLSGGVFSAVLLLIGLASASPVKAASCESLLSLSLPETTVTMAQTVPPGSFVVPPGTPPPFPGAPPPRFDILPAFCRVAATLKPTSDSDIKIEVWMPVTGWNEKFQAVGNGGWAGMIGYSALGVAVGRGYAASSTDTGHTGANGVFAVGHPEKMVDYAYRSEHEMAVKAKAIIQAFYGSTPHLSYWNGCSTGGKQALTEAQRYPGDFDGIIAGSSANYMSRLQASSVWISQAVHKTPESAIPTDKLPFLHKAVLEACDALDGLKDGLLEDPRRCHFDPAVLLCKGADDASCLSAAQVQAVKQIYSPVVNPRTKKEIFPPLEPGSESAWGLPLSGPPLVAVDYFKYIVFKNPDYDYLTLNFDSDISLADKVDADLNNAINPNLKPFFSHGGKLLMYHGWADQLIPPENSVNYYLSVVKAAGGVAKTADRVRLFMVPGMNHCRGGEGPNEFDAVGAMEQWVEQKKAPDEMIASHKTKGEVDRTRPLCPYPEIAKYKGAGSIDEAANFVCAAP